MFTPRFLGAALALTLLLAGRPAEATFHLMQIEQVLAGVDGSTATQAIQLRMRALGQNLVSNSRLIAWDANGENPVILIAFPSNVASGTAGSRVLVATANFASVTSPSVTPNFVLTNPIPDSYIPAGSITFEDNFETVYWRLSWGGAAYTGSNVGDITNDVDGDFGPAYADPLPTTTQQSLRFQFATSAKSTTNLADYALSAGAAVFTNNAGTSGTVQSLIGVPPGPAAGIALAGPIPNPAEGSITYFVTLPHETRVSVGLYDLRGRLRATLVDGDLPAGRNSLTWDPRSTGQSELGAGIYFLRLRADGVSRTARLVRLGSGAPMRDPHDE